MLSSSLKTELGVESNWFFGQACGGFFQSIIGILPTAAGGSTHAQVEQIWGWSWAMVDSVRPVATTMSGLWVAVAFHEPLVSRTSPLFVELEGLMHAAISSGRRQVAFHLRNVNGGCV